MAKKILKIKRVFAYAIYRSLRNTPPKDYLTTGEIKSTITDILPAIKKDIGEYVDMLKVADEFNGKKLTDDELKAKVDAINDRWKAYNADHGNDVVDIEFDDEAFKIFSEQFNREGWGRTWFANIDEFAEMMAAFDEAGKQVDKN